MLSSKEDVNSNPPATIVTVIVLENNPVISVTYISNLCSPFSRFLTVYELLPCDIAVVSTVL